MTYGKLKKRIYSLLDVGTDDGSPNGSIYDVLSLSINDAINSAARKMAATLMFITKRADVVFEKSGDISCADLPSDFLALKNIYFNGKRYRAGDFDTFGKKAYCSYIGEGTADAFYVAYPADMSSLGDEDELDFDDFYCDILAYGASLELCPEAYPGDFCKYSVLSTEYDERMANALLYGGNTDRVSNVLFSKRRFL